jgi:hypothetical protein
MDVRRPETVGGAATAGRYCSCQARGCQQDGDRGDGGRGRGVVVAAAALLLAGVDGDALADVARVGRPASA